LIPALSQDKYRCQDEFILNSNEIPPIGIKGPNLTNYSLPRHIMLRD
jgi:hypothetical protein